MLACFVPSLVTALCFPDEPLEECLKRQTTIAKPKNAKMQIENVTCLGIKKDSLAFLGMCTDISSSCKSGVSSRSLDCGSSSICCQVSWERKRFGLMTSCVAGQWTGRHGASCCKISLVSLESVKYDCCDAWKPSYSPGLDSQLSRIAMCTLKCEVEHYSS